MSNIKIDFKFEIGLIQLVLIILAVLMITLDWDAIDRFAERAESATLSSPDSETEP